MSLYSKQFFQAVKEARKYVFVSFLLFAAGTGIGIFNENLHTALDGQLESVRKLASAIEQSSNPKLQLFLIILVNNVLKALLVLGLGVLFAVLPAFFLVMNGAVLGYLYVLRASETGAASALGELAKGILPHGMIEIPAIMLAAAFGMKLGGFMYRWLAFTVTGNSKKRLTREWKEFTFKLPLLGAGITLLLLVAAIIESTLTPWILSL